MKVIFNELGVVTSYNFAELPSDSLRQGTVGNILTVKFAGILNANHIATLNFTRPDGSIIENVLMASSGDDEFKIVFDDPWYFALSGNATLTIFIHDSQSNITAQGQIQLPIEATDYNGNSVPSITLEQYNDLLSRINSKMNRTGISEIGTYLELVDEDSATVFTYDATEQIADFRCDLQSNTLHVRGSIYMDNRVVASKFYVDNQLITYVKRATLLLMLQDYATIAYTDSKIASELEPYATKTYVQEKISEIVLTPYELKTDATSKYNELNGKIADVRAVAEGKTKSYTISIEDNASFNSQDASLSGVSSIKDISGNVIQVSSLKNGDVILVVEVDVPDRWFSVSDSKFYQMETAKVDLAPYSAHVANSDIHVTSSDKSGWNGHVGNSDIHVTTSDKSNWNTHVGDTSIHVTSSDKSGWNAHVADATAHVTASDKTNWDGKSVVSVSGTGTSTTPISYITINGVEYAILPAQTAVSWGQISGTLSNQTDLKNALDAKQPVIDASHKISADVVDDTSSTNKFVSATEKSTWNGKQDALTFDSTPTQNSTNPVTSGGVYAECKNIREVAAGKCKTYVINTQSQITGTKNANDEYTGVTAISGVTLTDLQVGDQILIKELSVPDYWVSALVMSGDVLQSVSLNKMETSKVDLEGTNIKSTGETSGKALIADGSGGASWGSIPTGTQLYEHKLHLHWKVSDVREEYYLKIISTIASSIDSVNKFIDILTNNISMFYYIDGFDAFPTDYRYAWMYTRGSNVFMGHYIGATGIQMLANNVTLTDASFDSDTVTAL